MMHWFSIWLEVVSFNKNKAMFVSKEVKRKVEETPLYDLFNTDIFEVEIIGNIHTNPELAEMMAEFDTYSGELFISIDKAREQAEEYGHSFEREMGFLAVHGFLHINGYDHYTPEEEKEMFGLQEEILTAYGLTRQ